MRTTGASPLQVFAKEGESRRAARLRQSGLFCLRWCPFVWPFRNLGTGRSLEAQDGHLLKVRSLKSQCSLHTLSRGNAADVLTRSGGEE